MLKIKRVIGILKFKFLLGSLECYRPIDNVINIILRKKHETKIFCIGDFKTGTTSLYYALKILGIRTARLFKRRCYMLKNDDVFINKIKIYSYDAFVDFPMGYSDLYKKLDKAFPGSKFILTLRDEESFKKSYYNYYKNSHIYKYATPGRLEKRILRKKKRNEGVIKYFEGRENQFLILNVIDGEGWKKLCPFLNKPIPDRPFPRKNVGKYRKKQQKLKK